MSDEADFNDDDIEGIEEDDDDMNQQGEEYSDEEVEETEPEQKKEDEDPCDYEVYDDISQESSFTTNDTIQTSRHLNKYELARVLGVRTEMLNRDAPPMIEIDDDSMDTFEIAKRELKAGLCPLIIARPLPSGERVLVRVSSLIVKGI